MSSRIRRRAFLKLAAAPAAGLALSPARTAADTPVGGAYTPEPQAAPATSSRRVLLTGDGLGLTPLEHATLLAHVAAQDGFQRDTYLHGGPVEALEKRFAGLLGKERAVFLPTGTLANHLAVRVLAGERRRVLVQEESHFYRDEGDCGQLLSGLNLVPLGPGRATLTLEQVAKAVDLAAGPPYPAPVGAMSIESPVRRAMGRVFDFEEMKKVCGYARERRIGLHLDGARLFIASAYTGITPAEYATAFDTVYVSLYKYFNAPFGAILAGPAAPLERVETLRHQFGSLIYQGWETTALALHSLEGFADRFRAAVRHGEQFLRALEADGRFTIERPKDGTNVFGIALSSGAALDGLRGRLAQAGVVLGGAKGATQATMNVNETITRRPPDELARTFASAIG